MRRSILAVLLLSPFFPAAGQADDWPQYQGPGRDGTWSQPVFDERRPGALALEERWRLPIGSGYSGVVVAGGRLYTMTSDAGHDVAVAFDAASGTELWRTPLAATHPGGSGSRPGPVSTPAVARGLVVTVTPGGLLTALGAGDGEVKWRHELAGELGAAMPTYGIGTSPLVDGERVLVMAGGDKGYLAAFELASGELAWSERHGSGPSYASPKKVTLAGVEQILVPSGDALYAVKPADGSLLWSYSMQGLGLVDRMPLVLPDDRLFLPLPDTGGLALSVRLTDEAGWQVEKLWQTPRLGANTHGPPVYHDGHLYGMNGSLLVCLSAHDGTVRWRSRIYDGTLILVDGHLVVMSAGSGKVHIVKASPGAFEQVFSAPLLEVGHHTVTPPSYSDRTVYIRNVRDLVALDLRAGSDGTSPSPAGAATQPASGHGLREIWRRSLSGGLHSAGEAGMTVDGPRVVTLTADATTEHALALDARSGAELWSTPLDARVANMENAPASTPAVANGRLFLVSSACRLRSLKPATGEVIWRRDLRDFGTIELDRGCQSSPLPVGELLVVQTGSQERDRVVALRQDDGSVAWASDGLAPTSYTSPVHAVLDDVAQVLVHGYVPQDGGARSLLYGLRLSDGKALWRFQAEEFFSWLTPVVVDGDVLLPTWRRSYLLAVPPDLETAREIPSATPRWRQETLDSAVYVDGHLYAYIADDLVAIDAKTGEILWREDTFFGSLSLAGELLAVLSYKAGRLRLVEASPDAYRERAHLDVLNPGAVNYVWPVFADGTIFVRNREEIVAVKVPD